MSKHGKLLAALAGLGLVATAVWGDNNVLNHGTYYQNGSNGAKVDVSGNALTAAADPLSGQSSGWIALISDTTNVGMADSSTVQTTFANYIIHGLYIRATSPAGLALPTTRLAIEIRTHLFGLSDSVNTAPVLLARTNIAGVTVLADSLSYGHTTGATSLANNDAEFLVTLYRGDGQAAKFASPNARYIPISTEFGGPIRLTNFSVRERVLTSGQTTGFNTITIYAYCTVLR